MLKAAFIFLSSTADPKTAYSVTKTPSVELITVGVKDYEQGCEVARKLCDEGIAVIELCAGFGSKGVAKITEAVEDKIPIGVVRFDIHPGLENKSGDNFF